MSSPWQPSEEGPPWLCVGGGEKWDLTAASAGTNHSHFTLSCIHLRTMEGGGVLNGVWAIMILHTALQGGVVLQDACRPSYRTPPWGSASACLRHVLAQHSVPQWSSGNWKRNTFFLQDELSRAGSPTRSMQTKHMVHIFCEVKYTSAALLY